MFKNEVVNCKTSAFVDDHSGSCAYDKVSVEAVFDYKRSIAQLNNHKRTLVILVMCMVVCAAVVFERGDIFEELFNIVSCFCVTLPIRCNGQYNFGNFVHDRSNNCPSPNFLGATITHCLPSTFSAGRCCGVHVVDGVAMGVVDGYV